MNDVATQAQQIVSRSQGLAPMEGVTDFATRLWFQMIGGMDFTWTPFLRVTDTFPAKIPDAFAPEITVLRGLFPAPLYFQVMGSRAEDVVRTADVLGSHVDFIDLNCGCPSPTVVGSRAGSSLLQDPEIFGRFIEFVSSRVGAGRLSVKMRTGYEHSEEFPRLLSAIRHLPLRHLTVHGRTRPDRYTGSSNWELIEHAASFMSCPVIGSGDICDKDGLEKRSVLAPAVHATIVGRGALRNPWYFAGVTSAPVDAALVAFIVMQDIAFESPERLTRWVLDDSRKKFGNLSGEDWWTEIVSLLKTRGEHPHGLDAIQVSSRALSRGKMLWNYLRSSLPEAFLEPRLMRASKLSDFIGGIHEIARQLRLSPDNLPLTYRSELDWMYSGAGRGVKQSVNDANQNVGVES